MIDKMQALGGRWMALGLGLQGGMLARRDDRAPVLITDGGTDFVCGVGLGAAANGGIYGGPVDGLFPDFGDAATLGVALARFRALMMAAYENGGVVTARCNRVNEVVRDWLGGLVNALDVAEVVVEMLEHSR